MHDIAIVGAGPAGLLAATRCAEAGLDAVVLEDHAVIGVPTHCTGIVSLETMDLAKIPDDIVLSRLTRARLVSPSSGDADIFWDGVACEEILAIDRAEFDRSLGEMAAAAGAVLRTGTRVDRIVVDDRRVMLETTQGQVSARACILACGVSYSLQRQIGLDLPGDVIHTAQVEVDAVAADVVELHFGRLVAPGGFAWVVPIIREGRHRLKIGVMAHGDAGGDLQRFIARPEIRERLLGPPSAMIRRLLPLRPVSRSYADRVLLVGDAGGFTKPTTGGGIFYSLLTASLAAETLGEAFQAGRLDADFLGRYERRWRDQLAWELRVANWLRRLLTRCGDEELDALITAATSSDIQDLMRQRVRFNWHAETILNLVRRPKIASALLRALLR